MLDKNNLIERAIRVDKQPMIIEYDDNIIDIACIQYYSLPRTRYDKIFNAIISNHAQDLIETSIYNDSACLLNGDDDNRVLMSIAKVYEDIMLISNGVVDGDINLFTLVFNRKHYSHYYEGQAKYIEFGLDLKHLCFMRMDTKFYKKSFFSYTFDPSILRLFFINRPIESANDISNILMNPISPNPKNTHAEFVSMLLGTLNLHYKHEINKIMNMNLAEYEKEYLDLPSNDLLNEITTAYNDALILVYKDNEKYNVYTIINDSGKYIHYHKGEAYLIYAATETL